LKTRKFFEVHISAQTAFDFDLIRHLFRGNPPPISAISPPRFGPIHLSCGLRASVSDL
jgi:hypothetical protein